MGGIDRAQLVRGAGFKDLVTLADATDRELQHVADSAETAQMQVVYKMPSDDEGRLYTRRLFIDINNEKGVKNAKYMLIKFQDGWYTSVAFTKLR